MLQLEGVVVHSSVCSVLQLHMGAADLASVCGRLEGVGAAHCTQCVVVRCSVL